MLNADTLACTETVYLGHKAGAIFVPPAAVLDQVLVVESPADDYSLVHVLAPDAKTKTPDRGRPAVSPEGPRAHAAGRQGTARRRW